MYIIERNKISVDELEIKELERLLWEAKLRLRQKQKKLNQQSWLDWVFEYLGY